MKPSGIFAEFCIVAKFNFCVKMVFYAISFVALLVNYEPPSSKLNESFFFKRNQMLMMDRLS